MPKQIQEEEAGICDRSMKIFWKIFFYPRCGRDHRTFPHHGIDFSLAVHTPFKTVQQEQRRSTHSRSGEAFQILLALSVILQYRPHTAGRNFAESSTVQSYATEKTKLDFCLTVTSSNIFQDPESSLFAFLTIQTQQLIQIAGTFGCLVSRPHHHSSFLFAFYRIITRT